MVSFIKLLTQQAVHDQSNKICVSLQLNQTMNIDNFVQFIHVLLQDTESQATYREPVQYINVNVYQKYIDFDLTSISSIVYSNHIQPIHNAFAKIHSPKSYMPLLHLLCFHLPSPSFVPGISNHKSPAKELLWPILRKPVPGEGGWNRLGYIYIYDIWMWRQQ